MVCAANDAIFSLFFRRSSPLITRNFARLSPSGLTSVVPSRMAGTTRSSSLSSTLDAAALERLREDAEVEIRAGGVSGLVSGEQPDRRLQVLVVEQREEGHAQRRDRAILTPSIAAPDAGIARILHVTDDDA